MCVRKNETNKDQVLKLKEFSHGDTSIILIEDLLKTLEEYVVAISSRILASQLIISLRS